MADSGSDPNGLLGLGLDSNPLLASYLASGVYGNPGYVQPADTANYGTSWMNPAYGPSGTPNGAPSSGGILDNPLARGSGPGIRGNPVPTAAPTDAPPPISASPGQGPMGSPAGPPPAPSPTFADNYNFNTGPRTGQPLPRPGPRLAMSPRDLIINAVMRRQYGV